MCWGIRNMKKYQLLEVSSPNVEIEINGAIQESKIIKDMAKNPNFDDPILFFDVVSIFKCKNVYGYMNLTVAVTIILFIYYQF